MKISASVITLSRFALLCATVFQLTGAAVDPHLVHFGDIKLEPCDGSSICKTDNRVVGTLMVFYGDNYREPKWRPVCRDSFYDFGLKGSTAICNMLGYRKGSSDNRGYSPSELQSAHFDSSTDYALTGLDCTNTLGNGAPPNHLLRCAKFTPYNKDGPKCAGSLILTCSGPKGYPLPNSKHAYEGQVQLCPPDQRSNESNPAVQVSMGIVSVLGNSYWGSLNENDSSHMITHQQANSICRHLGFTGAVINSARTVDSYYGNYTFTNCQHPTNAKSLYGLQRIWLRVKQSQHCDSSCPCFSCCYYHPADGSQCQIGQWNSDNKKCSEDHCCVENNVVIECTFDQTNTLALDKPPDSGSETICGFGDTHSLLSSAPCTQQVSQSENNMYTEEQFLVGVLVPTVLLIFIIVVIIAVFIRIKIKRRGYAVVPGDDGHENREGGNNGNGNRNGNGNGNGNRNGNGNGNRNGNGNN